MLITQKQKALMVLIEEMEKRKIKSKLFMQKVLFLLKMEEGLDGIIKFYSFFPYKYGPFSYTSYNDINRLEKRDFIKDLKTTQKGRIITSNANPKIREKIVRTIGRFDSDVSIRNYVYKNYPEYAVKSELVHSKNSDMSPGIFTIGYEGKDIDAFLGDLIKNNIEAVVDVRFNPFSMKFDFAQTRLKKMLDKIGVQYVHIKSLGIEGSLRKDLKSDEDYSLLFADYRRRVKRVNSKQLRAVMNLGRKKRIALLCFEASKERCHRGVVADEIEKEGMQVCHL